MDLVVFSLIVRGSGGFFVDFLWIWWFFRGCLLDLVVFSWIFRGNGGVFVDFHRNGCFFIDFSFKLGVVGLQGPKTKS